MTNDTQIYNTSTIHELLLAAFTVEELRRFCRDLAHFRPVLDNLGVDASLNQIADQLIIHCEKRILFDELLAEVKQVNPQQYACFETEFHPPIDTNLQPGTKPKFGISESIVLLIVLAVGYGILSSWFGADTPTSKLFVVVYPQPDGVSLRENPSISSRETAVLRAGTQLEVAGDLVEESDDVRWWRVSSEDGEGWVAETYNNWRLIKPVIASGDILTTINPREEGRINLRSQECTVLDVLGHGTKLTVINGPKPQCDDPDSSIVREGREWWYVATPDDTQGWVADFSSDDKRMLVAPQWYEELSSP